MIPVTMPPYTSFKTLANGSTGYYWTCPTLYRKAGCPYRSAALGVNLSQAELVAAAKIWNDRLEGWRREKANPRHEPDTSRYGTVEWLVNVYLSHNSFLERVGEFSRADYKRVFKRVTDVQITKPNGDKVRFGDAKVNNVGVSTAEKVYLHFSGDSANRMGEKVVTYCKAMWKRTRPHHPDQFRNDVANPWEGVTVKRRQKATKGYVDRKAVYEFADGAIENGRGELAAAAVLAFEWLMRPSSIGAGFAPWTGYRASDHPDKIRLKHRKNDALALHPLEFVDEDGSKVLLYSQAEEVLRKAPRYGTSIVCKKNGQLFGDGTFLAHEVREMADKLRKDKKLSAREFSLDMCRHGGMTELEEKGLTEGQGRVLSKHKTASAYRGYAKETEKRVLEATKKRFGRSE
ncbi:hypothetical protein FY145_07250 [Agrobacterium tumefaciens]|uniref:Uncharacterized protein n=1 Tax=Agrobacterium tumefaciens TaxID=358 RepID=A0AAP9J5P7_AGRTU|nr:hypothetical protein [Agrobacterium tumefaciens]NSZ57826.1 hypothetical protein [Agrobacterium tumefaciens]QDY93945.1 hypothetical protein CG010_007250 [Agrobacterium tumefaciens]UXS49017.1 hypothetical protein FY149_17370 [Agrobacterium tumefaciens]UXS70321.1 hypothetical protein FY146_07250 [Agrobacterium tumefaciens]UXS77983.1 hypothetical protein FY145_07250 [Agrobacterium tumefaciens]